MPVITNVEDLRQLARRKVPKAIFEYIDHGSYDQLSLANNRNDINAIRFRQRVLIDAATRDLKTTMLGEEVSMPVAIAPTGLTGLMHGDGEMLAARAAEAAGIRFTLSTMSICSIEDVRSAIKGPFWFQLYVFKDRGFSEEVVERAKAAGCTALFVTVDLPMRGQRHCDIKNGLTVPPRITPGNVFDLISKPGWLASVLMGKRKSFGNIDHYLKKKGGIWAAGRWGGDNLDPTLSWKDIAWLRKRWPGKLVIKGILDTDDARMAVKLGADAIVVSNHGGRQLDGTSSSIAMLPRVVDAVGSDTEILFDGGIRTGADILRALALGARACMVGRAFVWGLGAGGQEGVAKAIDILKKELSVTMALTGVRRIAEVDRRILFS